MFDAEYYVANRILKNTGLSVVDAARLILEAVELSGNEITVLRDMFQLGARELEKRKQSIPFAEAVEKLLEAKSHLRPRSLLDIRQSTRRLMQKCPLIAELPLRAITSEDCRQALEEAFDTPRQRLKARTIMSGVFTLGCKRGWCSENPIVQVDRPRIKENEVSALTLEEVKKLLLFASHEDKGSCAAAVGMMVYAGIRPHEIQRLTWDDVCLQEKVISLRPRHSKTGGARHVTILPVLEKWLKDNCPSVYRFPGQRICPRNWRNKWKLIRKKAGWSHDQGKPWPQDCLRHTFASYHAKYFRNYAALQAEMGHRSSSLLRTRYLNMKGISLSCASRFWQKPGDKMLRKERINQTSPGRGIHSKSFGKTAQLPSEDLSPAGLYRRVMT